MSNEKKDIEYYMELPWTLIEGTDLDFNGNPYHYIEIKEIPSFAFCAKTQEAARANYKTQLRWTLMVMLMAHVYGHSLYIYILMLMEAH